MARTVFGCRAMMLLVAGLALFSLGAAQADPSSDRGTGTQAYIGVIMQDLTGDIAKGLGLNTSHGVLIADVIDGSPAEEAGIEDGDVVLEFDGKQVRNPENLKELVLRSRVGDRVKVKIIRDDSTKMLAIVVGSRPQEDGEDEKEFSLKVPRDLARLPRNIMTYIDPGRMLGVRVAELNEDLASYFGVGKDDGVLVLDVENESVAMKAGIKAGDVIRQIGADKVDSAAELKDAIREIETGDEFEILVSRHGSAMTMTGAFDDGDDSEILLREHSSREDLPRKMEMFHWDSKEMETLRKEMETLKTEMKKLKKQLKKEIEDQEED